MVIVIITKVREKMFYAFFFATVITESVQVIIITVANTIAVVNVCNCNCSQTVKNTICMVAIVITLHKIHCKIQNPL